MANTVYLSPLSVMWDYTVDASGVLNNGGNVYINIGGTTTPANTYTANGGLVLNPNPIQVGSTGRLPNQIWQLQGQAVDGTLVDVNGNVVDFQPACLGIDDPSFSSTQANLAFNAANAAYAQANTATTNAVQANRTANSAYAAANSAANTVAVFANGTIVLANANVNFNNTATVNVSAIANGTTQTNVSFSVNTSASIIANTSSVPNGYMRLSSNACIAFGNVAIATPSVGGTTVTFPNAFTSVCWGVQVTMSRSGGASGTVVGVTNISRTGFTISFDFLASQNPATTVYWQAVGD